MTDGIRSKVLKQMLREDIEHDIMYNNRRGNYQFFKIVNNDLETTTFYFSDSPVAAREGIKIPVFGYNEYTLIGLDEMECNAYFYNTMKGYGYSRIFAEYFIDSGLYIKLFSFERGGWRNSFSLWEVETYFEWAMKQLKLISWNRSIL